MWEGKDNFSLGVYDSLNVYIIGYDCKFVKDVLHAYK
jgi:hypothetical protein